MTTSSQSPQAVCAKCGKSLDFPRLSDRFSLCCKCKSCGGYFAVYIRDGNVRVDPIKASRVRLTAGIYLCAAVICGIGTIFPFTAAIVNARSNPFLLAGTAIASLFAGACAYFFLWKAILLYRGDPTFGFLHRGMTQSAAFNALTGLMRRHDERTAVLLATVASWITNGLIYRYGNTAFLVAWGTLWGPCTLLLTYFAFGGNLPLWLRRKGLRPLTVIPFLFGISLLAFIVVAHFVPPNPE